MSDGPWIDTHEGTMWTQPPGSDHWTPSIRNDALWEAKTVERTGFVNLARQWALDAVNDGWTVRPTYGDHEPVETAFTLERDGFHISGLARPGTEKSLPIAAIHIWGPDKLAIKPPLIYDMEVIRRGAETCSECGAYPIATECVGFAGRYCGPCAGIVRPLVETPGWAE